MEAFGIPMNRRLKSGGWVASVASLFVFALSIGNAHADGPDLGREATPEEIARSDLSISPDGRGLPPGGGTALEGESIYLASCARCHGVEGQGKPADRLVGGVGSLTTPRPLKTVGSYWPYATTLFDYIRRAMPYDRPSSLSGDEVYALSAYLLELNAIIPSDLEMNRETLPRVEMPNRDGFVANPVMSLLD
jgi:cytochrome c